MYGPWDIVHDRHNFPLFRDIFCSFTPLETREIKILKKWRNAWRYYRFTHVYQKWQSYHVWFLRYGTRWTEFFVILVHFLIFLHPNNLKNENFEKMPKMAGISSFYTSVTKIIIICYTVSEIWRVTDVIVIFHFGLLFALLPL